MQKQSNFIRVKRRMIYCLAVIVLALISVTPALADYIGPKRTVTETTSVCKITLNRCQYVPSKDDYNYKRVNDWSCSNENKPWQEYPSEPPRPCTQNTVGDEYWERNDSPGTVTNTYPPATINSSLQNCTIQNGWCVTSPQLDITGIEPVAGFSIVAIEGSLNGQTFACMSSSCSVPLSQGNNNLTYWALSTFGDSSSMGAFSANVDSQPPTITGAFAGLLGSNGWYLGPATFNGAASDATSGLAGFTCTLDGVGLGSCNTIAVNGEGFHTVVLTAQDNAGLTRTITQNTSIDTQSPTLNAAVNGTRGSNNWYTSATFQASASDFSPGSGLAAFEYNVDGAGWTTFPSSGVLSLSNGKHSVDIRATDQAGHIVSSSKSYWLDTSAPYLAVDSAGTNGANGWYVTKPLITASANDAVSGMDVLEYSLDSSSWTTYVTPVTLSDGTHHLSFWAQDQAGLVTQVNRTYQVDTRAPEIAGGLSGIPGMNGWYVSDVTLSASASDPPSGSGLDRFTYTINGSTETPYADPLSFSDGHYNVRLTAQDQAGLSYSIDQAFQIDTTHPSLQIQTVLPNWVKDKVTLSGTVGDDGSGIERVEISTDAGRTWQEVTGPGTWSYAWNTDNSPNGIQQVNARVIDLAGLTTQQTLKVGVDNRAPEIRLPDSWFQWDTVTLDIWDNESGLSEARVEITDPTGLHSKRVIQLDPRQFPLGFKWDRRFGDDAIAEAGTYDLKVIAVDRLGNTTRQTASIRILLDLLPAGPTATPQTYLRPEATPTSAPTSISGSGSSPKATQTAIVSVFGRMEPTAETITTPAPEWEPTPRSTPAQTNVLDVLQSIFSPDPTQESIIKIGSRDSKDKSPRPASTEDNGVLWGTAAAAAIGSAMAYVEEEKRKREEEKARQAALEKAEEERREKAKERHMEKMEAKRAQEEAWQAAAIHKQIEDAYIIQNDIKIARLEAEEERRRIIAQLEKKMQAEQKKKQAEEEKKQEEEKKKAAEKERLIAYYNAPRQGATITTTSTPPAEKTWWQKGIDWVDEHQTEIALGIGITVGIAALVLTGGVAGPIMAAAIVGGSALGSGIAAASLTYGLNRYYDRPWNENLLRNAALAGVGAAAVTGGWFLLQLVTTGAGSYCAGHTATCSRVEPVLNAIDGVEEAWLGTKLAIQTWRHDPAAADTALELAMEHMDGGMPGNSVAKKLDKELSELGDDALHVLKQYGDDAIPLLLRYQGEAVDIINAYGDEGIAILEKYGDDAIGLVTKYGKPAVKVLNSVGPEGAKKLLTTLDDNVLDYAIKEGSDAVEALSLWSADDLAEHGTELALRSKKDAKVLSDVKKLIASGPIDPKHLTAKQRELIEAIAANSTQNADEAQVVLGKWLDQSSGFVETAKDTGSVHYNPHPEMWKLLGGLGKDNQSEVAWLINQQVVQTGINKGLPFQYTLNGIPTKNIMDEGNAVEAIFAGATDTEIMDILNLDYVPIRIKELRELKKAGYDFTFDSVNNAYNLIKK